MGALSSLFLIGLLELHRGQHDVLGDGHVREQVEVLEDHSHLLTHLVDVGVLGGEVLSLDLDGAARHLLKQVEAAQEGRLSGPGGADDGQHLTLGDGGGDALEHLQLPEGLAQVDDLDHGAVIGSCGGHLFTFLSTKFDSFVRAKMTMK